MEPLHSIAAQFPVVEAPLKQSKGQAVSLWEGVKDHAKSLLGRVVAPTLSLEDRVRVCEEAVASFPEGKRVLHLCKGFGLSDESYNQLLEVLYFEMEATHREGSADDPFLLDLVHHFAEDQGDGFCKKWERGNAEHFGEMRKHWTNYYEGQLREIETPVEGGDPIENSLVGTLISSILGYGAALYHVEGMSVRESPLFHLPLGRQIQISGKKMASSVWELFAAYLLNRVPTKQAVDLSKIVRLIESAQAGKPSFGARCAVIAALGRLTEEYPDQKEWSLLLEGNIEAFRPKGVTAQTLVREFTNRLKEVLAGASREEIGEYLVGFSEKGKERCMDLIKGKSGSFWKVFEAHSEQLIAGLVSQMQQQMQSLVEKGEGISLLWAVNPSLGGSEDLLDALYPGGARELPIDPVLKEQAWHLLQKEVAPMLYERCAQWMSDPQLRVEILYAIKCGQREGVSLKEKKKALKEQVCKEIFKLRRAELERLAIRLQKEGERYFGGLGAVLQSVALAVVCDYLIRVVDALIYVEAYGEAEWKTGRVFEGRSLNNGVNMVNHLILNSKNLNNR